MIVKFRYIFLIAIFTLLIYFASQYYLSHGKAMIFTFLPSDPIIQGIALIIVIGMVSPIMYYFGTMYEKQTGKASRLNAEMSAYSMIADEMSDSPRTIIYGSIDEIHQLRDKNKIYLNSDRFKPPIKIGDYMRLSLGKDSYSPFVDCKVKSIENSSKKVELVTAVE